MPAQANAVLKAGKEKNRMLQNSYKYFIDFTFLSRILLTNLSVK